LTDALLVLVVVALGSVCLSIRAFADDGTTTILCGGVHGPACTLSASTPAQQPVSSVAAPPVQQVTSTDTSSSGTNDCQDPAQPGRIVPCDSPAYGWLGSDGCYYKGDSSFQPPASDVVDQPPPGQAGGYFLVTCSPEGRYTPGFVWLPSGPAALPVAAPVLPNPAVLAQQAVSQLTLPGFQIDASPATSADQLVGLPTWLWLDQAGWQPTTATAAVPGESVTATATPTSVTWNFGDGTSLTCQGPGTPYSAGNSPQQPSPTCGHTYTTTSANQPNAAFTVTATVSWTVTWAGGGQAGNVPGLQNTATTNLRVADVQSLNTAFHKEA
jgi:hypothetical protein